MIFEFENELSNFIQEIDLASNTAKKIIGNNRHIKLGDLNLRDNLHSEIELFLKNIFYQFGLQTFFLNNELGVKFRRLLIVYMSEMVYWDYETSFWEKLHEIFRTPYTWDNDFRKLMVIGFKENGINLIKYWNMKMYVRTIISESGFSRNLVDQAKKFVTWFFDHYSNLDPRNLDQKTFEQIMIRFNYGKNKDDVIDLFREMVISVSQLLKEIRRQNLSYYDLQKTEILNSLQNKLGFHPIKGIFGFRNPHDIQELIQHLSSRITPINLLKLLHTKILNKENFTLKTPDNKLIKSDQLEEHDIVFGEYILDNLLLEVVPDDSISLEQLELMILRNSQETFHHEKNNLIWIFSHQSFKVNQIGLTVINAQKVILPRTSGYIWFGNQRTGINVIALNDETEIARVIPENTLPLNPLIRFDIEQEIMKIIIPPFEGNYYNHSNEDVQLLINDQQVEDRNYLIGNEGFLIFQGTRIFDLNPNLYNQVFSIVTIDNSSVLESKTIFLDKVYLFDGKTGEVISEGNRNFGNNSYYICSRSDEKIEINQSKDVLINEIRVIGLYKIFQIIWVPGQNNHEALEIKIGKRHWNFDQPLKVFLTCKVQEENFIFHSIEENCNAAAQMENIVTQIEFQGSQIEYSSIRQDLRLIVEKDNSFVFDFDFIELMEIGILQDQVYKQTEKISISTLLSYLIDRDLITQDIGTYRLILLHHSNLLSDYEQLSSVDFICLPILEVDGINEVMIEGKESIIQVSCSSPVISDPDERAVSQIQFYITPQTFYDKANHCIKSEEITKQIRLIYPAINIQLDILPSAIFSVKLQKNDLITKLENLNYSELDNSSIILAGPDIDQVDILVAGKKLEHKFEKIEDTIFFPLSLLKQLIETSNVDITFIQGDFNKEFVVSWLPEFKFISGSKIFTNENDLDILIMFDIHGPAKENIIFRLSDQNLDPIKEFSIPIFELLNGQKIFNIGNKDLSKIEKVYCSVFYDSIRLDRTIISANISTTNQLLEKTIEDIRNKIPDLSPLEIFEKIKKLEELGIDELKNELICAMYSVRSLDIILGSLNLNQFSSTFLDDYFLYFCESNLPKISYAKMKMYTKINNTKLTAACCRQLIMHDDHVGVDHLIDLLIANKISWDDAIEIFSENKRCTSSTLREIIDWDTVERESIEKIEILSRLCSVFYPSMTEKASHIRDWKEAFEYKINNEIIRRRVAAVENDQMKVPIGLEYGIVPFQEVQPHLIKQIDWNQKPINRFPKIINLVVTDVNRRKNVLLLSEKKASQLLLNQFLSKTKINDEVEGIIFSVEKYGAMIDLGGFSASLSSEELSWEKVNDARASLATGQSIKAKIIKIDRQTNNIQLSIRAIFPNPMFEKYHIGDQVTGIVNNLISNGIFVNVNNEISGFIPHEELIVHSSNKYLNLYPVGKRLELVVLKFDKEKIRLTLSEKQIGNDNLVINGIRVKLTRRK